MIRTQKKRGHLGWPRRAAGGKRRGQFDSPRRAAGGKRRGHFDSPRRAAGSKSARLEKRAHVDIT